MAGNGSKKERLATLLAGGRSVRAAAAEAGVPLRTAYRWSGEVDFRRLVQDIRGRLVSRAVGILSRSMGAAAKKLRRLLASADERVALSASRSVLELAQALRQAEEFEARLAALEERAQQQGAPR